MVANLNNQTLKKYIHRISYLTSNARDCMKKYTISYTFFLGLYGLILAYTLSKYYRAGHIIFGGEGNYYLDFNVHFNTHGYAWLNLGTGFFGTSLNAEFFNVYFLIFLQNLFGSIILTNFILIFLIYFLPFIGIFLVCKELKISPPISFGIALFYITNPFSLNDLETLNQWNTATFFLIPIFFWIILRYFNNNFKLFFYFGLVSFIFAYANANPPLAVLHQISIVISVIIISYYLKPDISLSQIFKKYIIVLTSFILFNIWWIVNWFYVLADARKMYPQSFALSWLNSAGFDPIFWKIFTFTADIPSDPSYNFFSNHYNSTLAILVLLIPILIIFFYLLITKRPKKHILYLTVLVLIAGFLIAGVRYPLGGIYAYLILNNFIFSIFKTSTEKWGILYIFLFTLLLIFTLKEFKKERYYKYTLSLFVIYLAFSSIPFITSNFIPDYKIGEMGYGSRGYVDRVEYQNLREQINNDKIEYRVLSLPASGNYQVMLPISGDKYYTGMDPVLYNLNKPFIATYSNNILVNFDILFNHISSPNYYKYLAIYNIKKIVIETDMYPWFGFTQKENVSELERIFNKTMIYQKDGSLTIYDNKNYFLPRIYSADTPIFINGSENEMFKVVTSNNFKMNNTALFVSSQVNETSENFLEKYKIRENSKPAVTFQKINPTKYIVKIENATSPFFLVFSESYHPGWTAYFESEPLRFNEVIAEYKDINVNETKHENSFVIGDISYLFKKSIISPDKHILVNCYANGWYFDKPGTYYVTLYYWPQLLFYAGLLFSLIVLAVCSGILLFNRVRKNT
jgi:hypothetical protein